jgi:antitoxin component of RelBE/YafQ-DinJ toxin-antitoxin module
MSCTANGHDPVAGRPITASARIDLRIEPALKQWADAYARSLGIKVSGLIRMLLSQERQKVASAR